MKQTTLLLALSVPVLASRAQDPLPAVVVKYSQNFDSVTSVAATKLLPLGGSGTLGLTAGTQGGQRLAMRGDTGFALPIAAGSRVLLSFDFEQGKGSGGVFALGDDRDPQHGFSKILTVNTKGELGVCGNKQRVALKKGVSYRISVAWRWLSDSRFAVESVQVTGPGVARVLFSKAIRNGRRGGPIPFRHTGQGAVYLDNLETRVRR